MALKICSLAAFLAMRVAAFPSFLNLLPNSESVPCWNGAVACSSTCRGLGHQSCAGGGDRNVFGSSFANHSKKWTTQLCEEDSDGDGWTNGQELGDPCCDVPKGREPREKVARSHPGFKESTPPPGDYNDNCGEGNLNYTNRTYELAPTHGRLSGFNHGEEQRSVILRIANYSLPRQETTYVDFRFNFDDESQDVFHIVYGIALVHLPKNLHHFVVTGCSEKVPESEVGRPARYNECQMSLGGFVGWAPGGVLWDVPKTVGVPIGKGVGIQGLNIEVHFTDAQLVAETLISRDGIQIFYTPTLRSSQVTSMNVLGLGSHDHLVVPHGEKRAFITRTCTVMDHMMESGCFDYHADAINVAAALDRVAGGCRDLLDLCDDEGLNDLMHRYCPKTCGACKVSEAEELPGYRFVLDGYCCSEGVEVRYELDLENVPRTTLQGCADLCNDKERCVGFAYGTEGGECSWATNYPKQALVVHNEETKFFVKGDVHLETPTVGGPCDEENWGWRGGGAQPCGECQVLVENNWKSTCDAHCQSVGRTCVRAFSAGFGCREEYWGDLGCSESAPGGDDAVKVCNCSAAVVDEAQVPHSQGELAPLGERPMASTFYHAHTLGREMYNTRLRRNNVTDLNSQAQWDFNYQATFALNETLKSGDVITGTCVFDTSDKKEGVPIGLSTYEEMCFVLENVIYDLNTTSRQSFACVGGAIWTGSFDDGEDAKAVLTTHPWYDGKQVATGSVRGHVERMGYCNAYYELVKKMKCPIPSTWGENSCESFFTDADAEWPRDVAQPCLVELERFIKCMSDECGEAEQWEHERHVLEWGKGHMQKSLHGKCSTKTVWIPKALASKMGAQLC